MAQIGDRIFSADMIAAEERLIRQNPESGDHRRGRMPHTSQNISLHHVARAYHLRTVAFFDEALRHA
jgi:hypothetical protein